MSREVRILDLFSGIGGFALGAERASERFRTVAFCECDAHCRQILAHHWPGVPIFDDVRTFDAAAIGPVDVVTGGWPCQGNSLAGKRGGHADERSGLFEEILRVIDGLDPRPRFLCLENVPGLVSVRGGRDFAHVIFELQRRGYVGCVRMLDARYQSLAQRRRRLFFVAGLGAEGLAAVQLVLEGGARHPAPGREAGPRPAGDAPAGSDGDRWGRRPAGTVAALTANGVGVGGNDVDQAQAGHLVEVPDDLPLPGAVSSKWAKQSSGPAGDEAYNLVAYTEPAVIAFTERGRAEGQRIEWQDDLAYAQTNPGKGGRATERCIAIGDPEPLIVEGDSTASTPELPRLRAGCGRAGETYALARDNASGNGSGLYSEEAPALPCNDRSVPAVAIQSVDRGEKQQNGLGISEELCYTLNDRDQHAVAACLSASYGKQVDSSDRNGGPPNLVVNGNSTPEVGEDHALPLRQNDGSGNRQAVAASTLRRLTPTECERLQGFPDSWTCLCGRNRGRSWPAEEACICADGPRYRALGNAVPPPIIEWLLRQILAALDGDAV